MQDFRLFVWNETLFVNHSFFCCLLKSWWLLMIATFWPKGILIPPYLLLHHFLIATPGWRCEKVDSSVVGWKGHQRVGPASTQPNSIILHNLMFW
jgi:hypothetical protein